MKFRFYCCGFRGNGKQPLASNYKLPDRKYRPCSTSIVLASKWTASGTLAVSGPGFRRNREVSPDRAPGLSMHAKPHVQVRDRRNRPTV